MNQAVLKKRGITLIVVGVLVSVFAMAGGLLPDNRRSVNAAGFIILTIGIVMVMVASEKRQRP